MSTTITKVPRLKIKDAVNTSWEITNATDTDVVVINAYTDDDLSVEQLYQQSLKALQTTGAQDFIGAGASAVIDLSDAVKSNGNDTFSIIIAKADTLFPVKIIDLDVDSKTQSYLPVSITDEDAADLKLAEKFVRLVKAFPSSTLAQSFTSALSDNDYTKIDAFFKSTDDYKTLNLDMVVAIETYYDVYPFAWADYTESKTYALYTTDGGASKFAGSVLLSNQCAVPLGVDKTTPGFSIVYKKSDLADEVPLYYSNGQFTSDIKSDAPAICLTGLFRLKSDFTQIDTDNSIAAILTGTVNGSKVLGYDETWAKADKKGDRSILESISDPQTLNDYLLLSAAIVGVMLFIGLAIVGAKMARGAYKKWKDSRMDPEIKAKLNEFITRNQERLRKLGQSKDVYPIDTADYWKNAKARETVSILDGVRNKIADTCRSQTKYMDSLARFKSDTGLQKVKDSLDYISEWLVDNPEVFAVSKEDFIDLMKQFDNNLKTMNKLRDQLTREERTKAMNDAKDAIERNMELMEEKQERIEYLDDDRIPEIIE